MLAAGVFLFGLYNMVRYDIIISTVLEAVKMDNDEMLVIIKDMFEKTVGDIKKEVKSEIAEVKLHTGTLVEDLRRDVKVIAEGHSVLDGKIDNLQKDLSETKQELKEEINGLKEEINGLKKDMAIVKDYVIGVDAKLNEHEVILKRVK